MKQMKIIATGEIVKRIKEVAKSNGAERFFVAVKVPNENKPEYPDVLKISIKSTEVVKDFPVGAKVDFEAFVGGREWTNPEGKTMYFTDLRLFKIVKAAEPAIAPAATDPVASDDDDLPF